MLKLTLTSILIISSACAHAQAEAFIYPKTIDYIEKTPVASNLIIEPRSRGSIIAGGGAEYKIYSPYDNNINKKLKKEYFLVERNDSLFVNCHYLRDKWYSLSFFRNERYIFFVSGPSSLMNNNGAVVGAGLMFGLVGGAMAGMAQAGAKYNYVID
ncbi:MAG: hypothetical protein KDC07_06460, partial [Chitinophagaceae bacterium]|nr:hypothetical protein [Chitinophagaceae bacterium]